MTEKYINPVEKALEEGRSSITAEEAVGLRGKKNKKQPLKIFEEQSKKYIKTLPAKPKRGPEWEEDLIDRVARKLRELYYGPKTYLPKQKKEIKTVRTKGVEKGLKTAGLTKGEISKLRGKK